MNIEFQIKELQEVRQLIETASNIVIIGHKNPDGDAIGSTLGILNFFIENNIKANVVLPNAYPAYFKWLPNSDKLIINGNTNAHKYIDEADLIFCLDFNDVSRVGGLEKNLAASSAKKIMIDHHPEPSGFADYNFSDTSVCSTCEFVYEFLVNCFDDKKISVNVGECLYTGILTDTFSFAHNSSNPRTFEITSELLKIGIDKDKVYLKTYKQQRFERLKLLGHCLNKMEIIPEYKAAYISLTRAEAESFGFETGDTEGIVNYPLSIEGVELSAFFMEKDGQIRTSFRSKEYFNVNKFAHENFNGGGHIKAAGGTSDLSIDETVSKFAELLPKYKDELIKK